MKDERQTVIIKDKALKKLKGFVQIPNAILLHDNISFGAKVAYGVLLKYAWQDGFCFPAQESLAKDLNCSIRNVQRFLSELKSAELISWKQMGLNRPNVYYILEIKEKTIDVDPDTTDLSCPDTTNSSGQDTTQMSYYKETNTNTQNNVNVNGNEENGSATKGSTQAMQQPEPDKTDLRKLPDLDQPNEQTQFMAEEILSHLGDEQSKNFYYLVSAKVPEHEIRKYLSEIKNDGARNPAAAFTHRIKLYAEEHVSNQNNTGITDSINDLAKGKKIN